jgi:hypothetical protein
MRVGVPQGRSEALARGARRRAIEPRKALGWGADAVLTSGRQRRWRRFRGPSVDLTGSENLCMCAISPCSRPGEPTVTRGLSMMLRPLWVVEWQIGWLWVVRGPQKW